MSQIFIANLKQVWRVQCSGPGCKEVIVRENREDALLDAGRLGFRKMNQRNGNLCDLYCKGCFDRGHWCGL